MEHSQSARMGVASFSSSAVIPHSGSCWPPLPPRSIPTNVPHSRGTPLVFLKPSSHPPHISPLFPLRYPLKLGAAIPRCLPTNVSSASNSSSMSSTTIQRHRSAAAQLVGHHLPPDLVDQMVSEALVWCSLHGLLVADRKVEKSGTIPGVGLVHAPFALLPVPFPESHWRQACELAPIFNEVVDRVSLDAEFLQEALSRTKKVDPFTSKLLDIHSKMVEMGKKETIRLGLHRSDYMLDSATKLLYQIELNTIASSFSGLGCLVTELHRNLLNFHGNKLGMDSRQVAGNAAASQFAETLAKAWHEYNDPSAVVIVIAQPEEHNMYDQYWLQTLLKENHDITTIRKTLAEVDSEGKVLPDGTLHIDGHNVAVVYYRAGYSPIDYPTEKEWKARFLMEKSLAIKCPSISYHLVGTKKIQQELAKPNVLERFIENKKDIEKLRKCFAGLWSLDDQDIIEECKQNPELFVLKPQREGGGNNIYGAAARDTIIRLQNNGGEDLSAYILMQRIFPSISPSFLVRDGMYRHGEVVSELGIFGAYLRNNDKVVVNDQCGYLVRTKASSSNEGGVAAGFAVLDSIYLI